MKKVKAIGLCLWMIVILLLLTWGFGSEAKKNLDLVNTKLTEIENQSPQSYYEKTRSDLLRKKAVMEERVEFYADGTICAFLKIVASLPGAIVFHIKYEFF